MCVLGVKVNKITGKKVLDKIKDFLLSDGQNYIVTLNPEMVVEAQDDNYFKKIISNASLVIPDGIGILLAYKFVNNDNLPERISGVDLIYKICEADFIRDKKIYLLGAEKGIANKAARVLSEKYNYLNIVGAEEGMRSKIPNSKLQIPNSDDTKYNKINNNLIQKINNTKPNIIFVAFGVPKQEKWIYENLKKMPSVKLAIGVGGSFDFISGKTKRAPLILQKFGLEWLWRLILEPRRIKRIYNATVKFGWMVLKSYKHTNI